MLGQQAPWCSLLLETICLLAETSEEEDEAEDAGSSTKEQAGFDWVHIWMEEGTHQHWRRVNCRAYSSRYYL